MIRQTRLSALVAIPATILLASATFAQSNSASPSASPSGSPSGSSYGSSGSGSGSSYGGEPGGGGGSSTLGSVDSSTTTTTTTSAYGDDGTAPAIDDASSTLPNTGGEPLMVAMLGSMAAMGAFALRRKLS